MAATATTQASRRVGERGRRVRGSARGGPRCTPPARLKPRRAFPTPRRDEARRWCRARVSPPRFAGLSRNAVRRYRDPLSGAIRARCTSPRRHRSPAGDLASLRSTRRLASPSDIPTPLRAAPALLSGTLSDPRLTAPGGYSPYVPIARQGRFPTTGAAAPWGTKRCGVSCIEMESLRSTPPGKRRLRAVPPSAVSLTGNRRRMRRTAA
jgi:hypothetical protein